MTRSGEGAKDAKVAGIMIGRLRPYPKYKDSGVPWLGQVPVHWEVNPLAGIGTVFKGNGASKEDEVSEGVACIRYGDLYTSYEFFIRQSKAYIAPHRVHDYTPIRYGDVLFAASGETIEEIGKSAVNLMKTQACCGGDVLVLRPTVETDARFLGYATDSLPARYQKATMGRGFTVVHIYATQLKRLILAFPPLPEQTAIVRFLDWADRRIRRVIRARQKRIKLLEEYKQALIHRAVTGQIDVRTGKPYPEYKDSGVEWLGKVPKHWEVVRNGRLFVQRNESGFSELPILEVSLKTGVQVRDFGHSDRKQIMSDRDKYKRAVAGDLAYNMMRMWQGAVGIAPVDGLVSPAYVVARPRPSTDSRYFAYLFRTANYMSEVDKYSHGIVKDRNRLYWEDFKRMPSPCPPTDEQGAVADWIAALDERVAGAIAADRRAIELLQEFRTRLIADVVTGKLDVREAAARLPEEPDEGEELHDLGEPAEVEAMLEPDLEAEPEEATL